MIATRMVLRTRAREARGAELDDDVPEHALRSAADPELACMKREQAEVFFSAFRAATAMLDREARTILRLYYGKGLVLEEIAGALGWSIATAQASLRAETIKALRGTGLRDAELDGLLQLVQSRLDVSVLHFLRTTHQG